jgi:ribosomal protein S18 acetylase RimI-like enzyme
MEYRLAKKKDITEIVQRRIDYLQEHHNGLSDSYVEHLIPKLTLYFTKHLTKSIHAYVAVVKPSEIVAIALLLVIEKPARPSFMNGKTATVLNVYTKPAYRHQGLAEKLMRMLLADAHSKGVDSVDLTATPDGYPLYQKLGFHDDQPITKPMKFILTKRLDV